ncbi:hypothetical protein [Paenibacillus sp. Leaf72]|nr:hypothetical protein [Paenibacillus sp. Leaf72]
MNASSAVLAAAYPELVEPSIAGHSINGISRLELRHLRIFAGNYVLNRP